MVAGDGDDEAEATDAGDGEVDGLDAAEAVQDAAVVEPLAVGPDLEDDGALRLGAADERVEVGVAAVEAVDDLRGGVGADALVMAAAPGAERLVLDVAVEAGDLVAVAGPARGGFLPLQVAEPHPALGQLLPRRRPRRRGRRDPDLLALGGRAADREQVGAGVLREVLSQGRERGEEGLVVGVFGVGEDRLVAAPPAAGLPRKRGDEGAAEAHVAAVVAEPPGVVPPVGAAVAAGAAAAVDTGHRLADGVGEEVPLRVLVLVAVVVDGVGVDPDEQPLPLLVAELHAVMPGLEQLRQPRYPGPVGIRRPRVDVVGMVPAHGVRGADVGEQLLVGDAEPLGEVAGEDDAVGRAVVGVAADASGVDEGLHVPQVG